MPLLLNLARKLLDSISLAPVAIDRLKRPIGPVLDSISLAPVAVDCLKNKVTIFAGRSQ